MKIFKKLYFYFKFNWQFLFKIQQKSIKDLNNYAGLLSFNPQEVDAVLPKKIWVYWEGKCPKLVKKCLAKIKQQHVDYEFFILNHENITQFCDIDWTKFKKITPQQKADLIRFHLMYVYGGIWLDASILLYEHLDWIQGLLTKTKTQSFAFYRAKNTTQQDYPVLENWLLAAVPQQKFFKMWFDELAQAIVETPQHYIQQIKQNNPLSDELFQEIGNLEYLVAYVACQKVMRKEMPSIAVLNCDENALGFQVKNRWVKEKTLIELALDERPQPIPYLIKLTKKERTYLNKYYEKGRYFKNTLLDI